MCDPNTIYLHYYGWFGSASYYIGRCDLKAGLFNLASIDIRLMSGFQLVVL